MTNATLTFTKISLAHIRFKPLTAVFNTLLLGSGIAIILILLHMNAAIGSTFIRDLKGIDLVVSGKGSPLQIILSTVFQLDIPTGNIPVSEASILEKNPLVRSAIPMALGDNYSGYRIVGSNADYLAHYSAVVATGRIFERPMEAVVGSEVASENYLTVGQNIVGAHGLVNSDDLHSDYPYMIVGILAPTGTVLDRLVITPVESVWHVHEHPDSDEQNSQDVVDAHPEKELTALLLTYRTPLAAAQLPRLVNKSTAMQAASPAFEVARLSRLTRTGSMVLSAFGYLMVIFASFSFIITGYNALNERLYDFALMRSMGATRQILSTLIFGEALMLGLAGIVTGLLEARLALALLGLWMKASQHVTLEWPFVSLMDSLVYIGGLLLSLGSAVIPAYKIYRMNLIKILARA